MAYEDNDPRYQSHEWRTLAEQIRVRDSYACLMCGASGKQVDHIIAVKDGGAFFDPANLRTLCNHHHARKTWTDRKARVHSTASCALCLGGMVYDNPTNTHVLDFGG